MISRLVRLVTEPAEGTPAVLPEGAELRRSAWICGLAGRLAGMGHPAAAVTLGRTIVVHPTVRPSERLLRHELAHVRQWQAAPLTFAARYAWRHLRHGYRDNPYEVEARAAEHDPSQLRDRHA